MIAYGSLCDAKDRVGRPARHRSSRQRRNHRRGKPEDIQESDETNPGRHPIAIALRRQNGVDDARVSKREVLIRRGDHWFRYESHP